MWSYSTGNVADGCLALLEDLPTQHVNVEQLHNVVTDPSEWIVLESTEFIA